MSSNLVNPKRAGDDYLKRADLHEAEGSNKKPRFDYRNPSTLAPDADDADAVLDLDEIGKKGQQSKRNAVKLDGYESDSSEENFDQRAADKAVAKRREEQKSKDEEENDMFADLEEVDGDDDEEVAKEGKKPKKEVRFMDQTEIEGQVASSKAGGHISADFSLDAHMEDEEKESSSDDSGGEEERARVGEGDDAIELGAGSKKHHAPKVDAFNMKNEAEEGKFDANGNFIRNAADPFAVHDSWLEGSTKADMKRAKEAREKREEERRKRDVADDAVETADLLSVLISRLEKDETVLEGLARLGSSKGKVPKKRNFQRNKSKNSTEMDVDAKTELSPQEEQRRKDVEAITGAADQLLIRGQDDIYDTERAMLLRQYKRESGKDWSGQERSGVSQENSADKEWEYRWSDSRDGGEIHGPYDGRTMEAWNGAGYFGEGVEFRQVGSAEWSASVEFVEAG